MFQENQLSLTSARMHISALKLGNLSNAVVTRYPGKVLHASITRKYPGNSGDILYDCDTCIRYGVLGKRSRLNVAWRATQWVAFRRFLACS